VVSLLIELYQECETRLIDENIGTKNIFA